MNLDLKKIPVIYINLSKDTEKNNYMQNMLKELNFEHVIRLEASQFPKRHLAGCSYSHYEALGLLKPPFIIMEDDCKIKNFIENIEIPENSDAIYLGISSWGRMNSHSGPFVQYEKISDKLFKIYNMLGAHAILYLNEEYVSLCKKIAFQAYETSEHQDIGFAEVQKYYNVYAFNDPLFYQTSSNGTDNKLDSYPTFELFNYNKNFWKPTAF
jgi:hypothetical protein